MTDHRVLFDFEIEFANGGGLQGQGFRLDIEGDDISDEALADLLVADLRLLMVSAVRITGKRVIEERHRRALRDPRDRRSVARDDRPADEFVDLSHPIRDGMVTYPGLPVPAIGTHLGREASRERYAPGTEFHIGTIAMVANTGTYLDTPFHRYADGVGLVDLPAASVTDVPGAVIRAAGRGAIDVGVLADVEVRGRAVLFHTGRDRDFGTPAYAIEPPFLTEATARRLVEARAVLVGIDALNVDSTDDPRRPVHSLLLAAGIPVLEHLTGLEGLPDEGFEVTALPPRVDGLGSFPVRVVARLRKG